MKAKYERLGKYIKHRREGLRLSQAEVAKYARLGTSIRSGAQFLSNIERGLCLVPANRIKKMAKILGLGPEFLSGVVEEAHNINYRRDAGLK